MSDQTGSPFVLYVIVFSGFVLVSGFVGLLAAYLRLFEGDGEGD